MMLLQRSGRKPVPTSCRFLTARSTSRIASSASSSSLTGQLLCAKCAGFYLQRVGSQRWCGAAFRKSPGFEAFAEILERNVSPAAATIMRAPFGLSDANELSRLVAAAGFRDITIQQRVGAVGFPSVERFVLSQVAGSPLASHVSQASDVAREHLTADTKLALEKYVGDRGLSLPVSAHLLTASREEG